MTVSITGTLNAEDFHTDDLVLQRVAGVFIMPRTWAVVDY